MKYTPFIFVMCLLLMSCQKALIEEEGEHAGNGQVMATFKIGQLESYTMGRSTDIATLCNRINAVAYKNGSRVKQINQTSNDDDFGNISMALDSGSYNIVILAHSYSSNPTLTKPKKITFGHDLTDTFLWTEECNLDENQTKTVNMHRVVGMFRLTTTDTIPSNVASVRFYYTGGSSSLDASTGLGCVDSRQTSSFTITEDMKRQTATFDAYTFPKAEEGSSLTINVTALDKNDNVVAEKQFVDIPVMRNQITSYHGKLFSGGDVSGGGNVTIHLATDDEWTVVEHDF